jgi:hypothetical protein
MVRAAIRLGVVSALLAEMFAMAPFASAQAQVSDHGAMPQASSGTEVSGQSSKDDSDEVSPLIVTGDFNQDGIADIARITLHAKDTSEPDQLTVLLGQSNATFKGMVSQSLPGRNPRAMVSGDFNNDGIPDLIVGDEDGTLRLFLGDGAGSFNSGHEMAHLESVISIAVADFNNDGILDLAITDWRMSSATVLLGAGKGSFDHMWSFPLRMRGTRPHIAAADFNGDGAPDLAVIYDGDEEDTYDVMLGNGNGTFTIAPEKGLTRNPNSHCNTL